MLGYILGFDIKHINIKVYTSPSAVVQQGWVCYVGYIFLASPRGVLYILLNTDP